MNRFESLAGPALLLGGAALGALAASGINPQALAGLEERIADWLLAHPSPALKTSLGWILRMHSSFSLCILTALLAAGLLRRGEWRITGMVVLIVPGGLFVYRLLMHSWFSFPASATVGAVLFYGALGAALWPRVSRMARAAYVAAALLFMAAVGFSHLYLAMNYLGDELAAASASVAWLVLCLSAGHAPSHTRHH